MVTAICNLLSTWIFKFIAFMIRSLYNLILMLADVNLLENDNFKNMKSNIFGLIGLFMVFKLAFSIIQYITNPDKLSDSSTGAGKLLTKVVVVLVLLGTINTIFDKAFELQGLILKDAVLERLIFGTSESAVTNPDSNSIDPEVGSLKIKTSDYLAYSILAPFVTFNTEEAIWGEDVSEETLADCDEFIKATDPYEKDICHSHCVENIIKNEDPDAYDSMCKGLNERNMFKALIDVAMTRIDKKAVIVVDGFFGLLIGAVCIVVLTIITVGVAIRSVKLSFLSLIAPIPIITYIDPKENSNSMFNKWSKETIKTFLELFIRLLSFYFAILIITKVLVSSGGVASYSGVAYKFKDYPLVIIFLIVGCFLFALQLPKLIENLFGSLGGMSRDAKSTAALAGGIAGIAGGIVGGAFSNAIGTAKTLKDANGGHLGVGGVLRSGLAFGTGAVGTGLRATQGAIKGFGASGDGLKGSKWNDIASNSIARTGAVRNARMTSYTTAGGKVKSAYPILPSIRRGYGKFADMAGIKDDFSAVGRKKADIKAMENALRGYQNDLAKASNDRMAALQHLNNVTQQRDSLSATPSDIDKNFFDDMGGRYDAALGDYVFNHNGQDIKLSELKASEYSSIYSAARRVSADKDKFDRKYHDYNTTTFEIQRNRLEDDIKRANEYESKIASLNADIAKAQKEFADATTRYDAINTDINSTNQMLNRANREVETIKNANKK